MFWKEKSLVSCEECNCLLEKWHAQIIRVNYLSIYPGGTGEKYYCKTHAKNYSDVEYPGITFGDPAFFKKIQVDENGEPVGYKKNNRK